MVDTYIKVGDQTPLASSVTVPADRNFRGAWVLDGTVISEDITSAKAIFKDKIREVRKPLLEAKDVELMKALETSASTTAIATADVGAEGLGFAVPINLALNISKDLVDDGKVYHSFLGILGAQHFEVAEDGARIFSGVEIQELYGPANDIYAIGKAGALPGDIIKKVNGKNIKTLDGLISFLRSKKAGDEISIEIIRNGQVITLEFLLDLRPSDV